MEKKLPFQGAKARVVMDRGPSEPVAAIAYAVVLFGIDVQGSP